MKNAFVIVTLSSVLAACAVAPQPQSQAVAQSGAPAAAKTAADAEAEQKAAAEAAEAAAEAEKAAQMARLPKVELTSTLLNQLLRAEFAFRNGDWQGPYLTMLALAQQTRDPRLARRASEMALAARQPEDTLAAVREWRKLDPESDEATQYYLGMVILSDNISDAEEIFRKRLAGAPPMPASWSTTSSTRKRGASSCCSTGSSRTTSPRCTRWACCRPS